jgi:uncharacterized Fe-S center protein
METIELSPFERAVRAIEQTPVMSDTYAMAGEDAVALARAVLQAVRDPSEAMLEAGEQKDLAATDRASALTHWQAMIDAALAE